MSLTSTAVRNTHYQNGTIVTFLDNEALLYPPEGKVNLPIKEVITASQGMDMIGLAYEHYGLLTGDPRPYWALIALANPHISNTMDIPLGETVLIPEFTKWPISTE